MRRELKEALFYLIVGTVFFYGSINVQYRDQIIRADNLFDSYLLLIISLVFLFMFFWKYIDWKFKREMVKKKS